MNIFNITTDISFTWVVFGVVILLACYRWFARPSRFPPGPRGIPILGNALFLGKYPERTVRNLSKKYGAIMSLRMGGKDWVFLNNYTSIVQALVKQSSSFSGRSLRRVFDKDPAPGLASRTYDESFKIQRKFGLMNLRRFGSGLHGVESICLEEISYLNEALRSENGKPFDISVLLHKAISNNICTIAIGKRFMYDDKKFEDFLKNVLLGFGDPVRAAMLKIISFLPNLRFIPPFSRYFKEQSEDIAKRFVWYLTIIEEHMEIFNEHNIRDFVDAFILEIKKNTDPSFTKSQLKLYVRDLFIAGTETTSTTLHWSLLCLLHHPQIQKKLCEEIFDVVGQSGIVNMSHKPNMPYTNAFIQEIYRYRTIAPMAIPHTTTQDAELGGYFIPKNTMVIANLWAVHNDPELFEEPEKFKPERFLDEKGNYLPSKHVIPFSVGPRHCLGEQLARIEVFIFLVGMIQKFEFLPDPEADQLPDIEDGSNGLVFLPTPYKIVAKEH